jgi:predicted ATPase
MGKTRLAMALASELPAARIRWVDLVGKKTEEDVALAVLFALGSREGEDLESILHRTIQQAQAMVLFLDNCEQACAVLAGMVDRFLRTSPELVVVATSRVALRLSYESMIEVGPIESLEEACALFEQRAMARRGPLTAAERPLVAAIVSRLEHIPLAIELAAARTGTLSLEDLAKRLEQDLSILADRARDRPERQRDFVAAVSSTFQLLEPASRAALARLALFRGGFDLAGVEAVLQSVPNAGSSAIPGAGDAAAIVEDLAQASLIYRLDVDGLVRFRMYECLRQCALEALSGSERAATLERIARFLAETGAALSDWTVSLDEPRIRALRADLENYRSLWTQTQEQPQLVSCFVQLGCVLGSIYLAQGPLVESLRLLTKTVELARPQRASIPDPCGGIYFGNAVTSALWRAISLPGRISRRPSAALRQRPRGPCCAHSRTSSARQVTPRPRCGRPSGRSSSPSRAGTAPRLRSASIS